MQQPPQRIIGITSDLIKRNFNAYPVRSTVLVVLMLLSASAESIGVVSMLPLLNYLSDMQSSENPVSHFYQTAFDYIGIDMGTGALLSVVCISIILKNILKASAVVMSSFSAIKITRDLRQKLLKNIMTVKWGFITQTPVGSLTNSLSTEAERSGNTYFSTFNFISELIFALVLICGSLIVDVRVTALACTIGILYAVLFHRFVVDTQHAGKRTTQLFKGLVSRLTESLQGLKMLKAMSKQKEFLDIMSEEADDIQKAGRKAVIANVVLKYSHEPVIAITIGIAVYSMVVYLNIDVTEIIVLTMLFGRLTTRIASVQRVLQGMAINESAYYSVHEILSKMQAEEDNAHAGEAVYLRSGISVNDVSFSYGDHSVLKDVNLTIPVGEITALVGPSGGGKSTICDLILGFISPDRGEILCDGYNLKNMDLEYWRNEIGYVPQENFMFHETIRKNITLGSEGITDSQVKKALEDAGAMEFVSRQPQQLDTVVGERGLKISGGQRQRLCLARALIQEPRLLILDEPTAALDQETTASIHETLESLKKDRAILIVSHHEGISSYADRVYKVSNGIVEHDQYDLENSE